MGKIIWIIGGVFSVFVAFVLYCCIRVGAQYDAKMKICDKYLENELTDKD